MSTSGFEPKLDHLPRPLDRLAHVQNKNLPALALAQHCRPLRASGMVMKYRAHVGVRGRLAPAGGDLGVNVGTTLPDKPSTFPNRTP